MTTRRSALAGVAALALAGIGAYFAFGTDDGPVFSGRFSLVDGHSNRVTDADYRGRYLIVYFGYTFCPDICPTALGELAVALNELSPEKLDRIAVVFISVDPKRDHGEHLAEYGKLFHPKITGLTGTPEAIAQAAANFGAKYRFVGDTNGDDYSVDHTSVIYVLDPQGRFVTRFTHAAPPEAMLAKLDEVVR